MATGKRDADRLTPARRTSLLRAMLDEAAEALVALDEEGVVIEANSAADDVARRSNRRQAIGYPFTDLIAPEDRERFTTCLRRLTSGEPQRLQVVLAGDGEPSQVTMAKSVAETTVAITPDTIGQSRRIRHDRALREFVRNAAHQLRTPLAGISAAVETLQAGAKHRPVDRDRFIDHIQTQSVRLTRLAHGLLLLARAQAGEPPPVSLILLAPFLKEIVESAHARNDVTVTVDCPADLTVVAAPDLLREALGALVDNAVTHTAIGQIVLHAALAGRDVVVAVTDTGSGIAPEDLDRMFDPFSGRGISGSGYGIGLAIVAQAVEAMRGEIDVSTILGEGTTFAMTLPGAAHE